MRYLIFFTVTFIVGFSARSSGQSPIPNGGYEQWDSIPNYGFLPTGWLGGATHSLNTIYRSSDAHSGSFGLGGRNVVVGDTIEPPYLETIALPSDGGSELIVGFPMKGSPAAFEGWFKFNSIGNDIFKIYLFYNNSAIRVFTDSTSHSTYTHFSLPLPHMDSGTALIEITVENSLGTGHVGTEFVLDDLSLVGQAGVERQAGTMNFGIQQNYLNPFNRLTTICYSLPEEDRVTIEIINIIGDRVALLDEGQKSQGEHEISFDGEHLSSGPYLCRLISASQGISSKIIQLLH